MTYQYSVKDHVRPIDHSKGSHGTPGIYFKYDLSALKVEVSQDRYVSRKMYLILPRHIDYFSHLHKRVVFVFPRHKMQFSQFQESVGGGWYLRNTKCAFSHFSPFHFISPHSSPLSPLLPHLSPFSIPPHLQAGFHPVPSSVVRGCGRARCHLRHRVQPRQEPCWLLLL